MRPSNSPPIGALGIANPEKPKKYEKCRYCLGTEWVMQNAMDAETHFVDLLTANSVKMVSKLPNPLRFPIFTRFSQCVIRGMGEGSGAGPSAACCWNVWAHTDCSFELRPWHLGNYDEALKRWEQSKLTMEMRSGEGHSTVAKAPMNVANLCQVCLPWYRTQWRQSSSSRIRMSFTFPCRL